MSSTTTYAESVASWHAPTPVAAATVLPEAPPLPVRRQLDFPGGGGGGNGNLDDEDDDFLFRAAEEIERSLHERRASQGLTQSPPPVALALAPPTFPEKQCICGRGPCHVEWREPRGWTYVCSAPPKCKHFSYCEESDVNQNSQPAFGSHPETNHPPVFNTRHSCMVNSTTQVNVSPHGAGAITPVTVSPQGAGATTPVNFSPQGAKSSGVPTCKCTAGKCRTATEKGVSYYVCHIPKGYGACSHREPVNAAAEDLPVTGYNNPWETGHLVRNPVTKEANGRGVVMMGGHNETRPFNPDEPPKYDDDWPFDIVEGDVVPTDCLSPAHPSFVAALPRGSPSVLQQPVGMVDLETPTKSPKYTISPTTPRSNNCYRCGEGGHFAVNCPKNNTCYGCNVVGHWVQNCPEVLTKRW
uniref:Uncharacterized protein n=1 Tax=Avena sativa TaxID=4498 RepID=A0ACD5WXQ2_AVESA